MDVAGLSQPRPVVRKATTSTPLKWFKRLLVPLLAGYLFFGRPFAYLHIPGTPIYVGEVVLVIGTIEAVRYARVVRYATRCSLPLRLLLAFMAIGALGMLFSLPEYGIDAIRDSAPWYYGTYAFLVAVSVRLTPQWPARLRGSFGRILPWFLLWAPLAVFLGMQQGLPRVAGTATAINDFKPNDIAVFVAMAITALWAFEGEVARQFNLDEPE